MSASLILHPIRIKSLESDKEKLEKESSDQRARLQELEAQYLLQKDEYIANVAMLDSNELKLKKVTQENDQLVRLTSFWYR